MLHTIHLPTHLLTPAQRAATKGRTRKASIQADGKTLHFFRLDMRCKQVVWMPTNIPTHYRTKAEAEQAKEAWEVRGEYLNKHMRKVN